MRDTRTIRQDKLRLLINEVGGTTVLAKRAGKSTPQVSQWASGARNISHEMARLVEHATGKPRGWLDEPISDDKPAMCNVDAPLRPVGAVPLISWVMAGEPMPAVNPFQPGDGFEWVPCPDRHSPTTFALRVMGDSMVSPMPGAYSYPEGTVIFCDPAQPAHIGSHVIARVRGEVTFKVLAQNGTGYMLKALNPAYDPIMMTEGDNILAVVIGAYRSRSI